MSFNNSEIVNKPSSLVSATAKFETPEDGQAATSSDDKAWSLFVSQFRKLGKFSSNISLAIAEIIKDYYRQCTAVALSHREFWL